MSQNKFDSEVKNIFDTLFGLCTNSTPLFYGWKTKTETQLTHFVPVPGCSKSDITIKFQTSCRKYKEVTILYKVPGLNVELTSHFIITENELCSYDVDNMKVTLKNGLLKFELPQISNTVKQPSIINIIEE